MSWIPRSLFICHLGGASAGRLPIRSGTSEGPSLPWEQSGIDCSFGSSSPKELSAGTGQKYSLYQVEEGFSFPSGHSSADFGKFDHHHQPTCKINSPLLPSRSCWFCGIVTIVVSRVYRGHPSNVLCGSMILDTPLS